MRCWMIWQMVSINYFWLQFKRSLAAFSHMLGSLAGMLLLVAALAWGISRWFTNVQMFQKVTVGIVMPEDAGTTGLLVDLVSGMESVSSICTFSYLDEEEATAQLLDGTLQAAVCLPADFYEDVNGGTNTPLKVYFPADDTLNQSVFRELLLDGVSYVQVTEAAIYSAADMGRQYTLLTDKSGLEELLSYLYISHIFARGSTFTNCVLSATGEISFAQYYFVIGILLFLLLGSMCFSFFYGERETENAKILRVHGIGPFYQSAVRTVIMAVYVYLVLAVCYAAGGVVSAKTEASFLFADRLTLPGLVPLALAMAAFFHMVYGLANRQSGGNLLLLGVNGVMVLCAGGILPSAFFPAVIQRLGACLPLRFWIDYLERVLFGKAFGTELWWELLMAAVFFLIGTVGIWKNS